MFEFKSDKKENNDKEKALIGAKTFILIGLALVILGALFLAPAFAFNQTAIDELQLEFNEEVSYEGTFSFFYIAFLLVVMAGFIVGMFAYREDRESVFFSLSALIIAFVLTLMFISPLTFDIQEHNNSLTINANDTDIKDITVIQQTNQIIIIPYDEALRMSLSLIFTGLSLFLGLYSMYIVTNYHEGRKLNPNRG